MKLLAGSLTLVGLVFLLIGFNTDYSSHAAEGHGTSAHAEDHTAEAPAVDVEAVPAADEATAHEAEAADSHAEEVAVAAAVDAAVGAEGDHAEGHEAHAAEGEHAAVAEHTEGHDAHGAEGHDAHAAEGHGATHDLSANRPWAAFLVNSIFFLGIGIGTLFFLAIQYAAQVGWSAGLIRVFEAVAMFVGIPLLGILLLAVTGGMHLHHLWHWMAEGIMDPASANYDPIIAGKEAYLNVPFFTIRTLAYLVIWAGAAYLLRRNSLREDAMPKGQNMFFTQRKLAATFIVLYAVTSSTSAWDWVMSIDTHWFSTLFGWYTFAGMFVTAMTVLNLLVMYLRLNNHLPWINANHQHDLGKFMFAFSVFWTYLWFSQYMLIWYSNIPEEVTYYLPRFKGEYKPLFVMMVAMNFIFPILVLMSRDAKRIFGFIGLAAFFVLAGHWMDHYIMIMPGAVGYDYGFGFAELGGILFYAGLFLWVTLSQLAKAPLKLQNHPMLTESEHFHQ
ncbi:MAG: quinol:cytochrome C oxidoreductase [Bacteroidota bacterium]